MTAAAPAEPGRLIYKICSQAAWREAQRAGFFLGSPVDLADGYIQSPLTGPVLGTYPDGLRSIAARPARYLRHAEVALPAIEAMGRR